MMSLRSQPNRQQGAVLIVSLLMLLVMTLIGVTAMRNTGLEERMAGYTRDRNTALQSAELALREAEQYIESLATLGDFQGTNGLYREVDTEPDWADPATWTGSPSRPTNQSVPGTAANPRYFIKHIGVSTNPTPVVNVGSGYGTQVGAGDIQAFFITAHGVGANAATEVVLRGYYGRQM